ncbi:MAG: hypothetical protein ACREQ5_28155, partial [Candidatus Dormibacteria bacterium]
MPGRTVRCLLLVPCALLVAACGDAAIQSSGGASYSGISHDQAAAAAPAPGLPVPPPNSSSGSAGTAADPKSAAGTGTN